MYFEPEIPSGAYDLSTTSGRLRYLADVVLPRHEGALRMTVWYTEEPGRGPAGCAAGWAAMDPLFRREGYGLTRTHIPFYRERGGTERLGGDALQAFFGLSRREVIDLFLDWRAFVHASQAEILDEARRRIGRVLERQGMAANLALAV